jgi:GNAT superfamily N-acetyltransferase
MLTITEATPADIPALCELLRILFSQEAEFLPDKNAQKRGLEMILNNPGIGRIFAVHDGTAVVGMANLLFSVSTALGERVAVLEDVVVTQERRGEGIGRQLLDYVKSYAADHQYRRITLLTDADNLAGQRFYASCGFSKSAMLPMRISL